MIRAVASADLSGHRLTIGYQITRDVDFVYRAPNAITITSETFYQNFV